MMSMNTFSSIFPEKTPTTLAIKIDESLFSPFMRALLESDNINYGTIINEKKVKQVSLEIFDNTFKISFQLALVTLIVAGFTLYTNLVTVKKLRMKDILPLNAIGIPMLTLLKLDFQKSSDSLHEVSFLFMIDEEILTYTWTVNTDTGEISSVNQEAKRILDIVDYYN